jgi:uncharacterized protein YyaL (SSP411 family)
MLRVRYVLVLLTVLFSHVATAAESAPGIAWQPWSAAIFEQAEREHKFVILDLEAVWCHWCHVMDEATYHDPKIIAAIAANYIAVRVDQDAQPDVSKRYENYGWPATVVFNTARQEIVKLRGYVPPARMLAILQDINRDPSPVVYRDSKPVSEFSSTPLLEKNVRQDILKSFADASDTEHGGFRQGQKFLDRYSVEYLLTRAAHGDGAAQKLARINLDQGLKLIDPAWGGVYQYSTDGDWVHPHFEKIMAFQAYDLRLYAAGYGQFGDVKYLSAAQAIARYMSNFLTSPQAAFYTSQDADLVPGQHSADYFSLDDGARRKLGIPRIDTHRYARENGWAIQALTELYSVTGDVSQLDAARKAANWIIQNRALTQGGFRHDERDAGGPYLGDTLAMGQACLALYSVTAERRWLTCAGNAAQFIDAHFATTAGYLSAQGGLLPSLPTLDENIEMARFANLLAHYTGDARYRPLAERAMRFLVTREVALAEVGNVGIVLADDELSTSPLQLTIVGHKDDPQAQRLFSAAVHYPGTYKRVEWWDTREGRLPNPDVQYPELAKAAAFVCSSNTCSLPVYQTEDLLALIKRLQS